MNIQQVIYVMHVYDYHSFTEAAKSLYISQPRLSQAIRELEQELGFEIFERNRKGISGTTVKGQEFIEKARTLLSSFYTLEALKEQSVYSFSLATTLVTQAQDAFLDLCAEEAEQSHIRNDVWFCGCREATDRVKTMASDMAVIAVIDEQLDDWKLFFEKNNIDYHELISRSICVTLSADSPLAGRESVSYDDLRDCTYIAERCSRMNDLTQKVYSIIDSICPDKRITVSNTDMMYRLASGSMGVQGFVFEPLPPSAETLDKYSLVSIPVENAFSVHLGYISLRGRKLNPLAERYIELLRERLGVTHN